MQNTETNEKDGIERSTSGKNTEPLTRDQVLRLSSQTIRQLHKRVNGVRFKVQSGDSARLSHVRSFSQLIQVYGSILKDTEITELAKRVSELEQERECRCKS
ncbi:MAG: hypothetical protein NTW33_02910 [Methanoregula sp.]|nr:hypothetical protein [Methanoregula sp.]